MAKLGAEMWEFRKVRMFFESEEWGGEWVFYGF